MGTEALLLLLICAVVMVVIAVSSWCRRRKLASKDFSNSISRIDETVIDGQRTFRIATVSRHSGQLALDVYEIRLPRPEESTGSATITLLPPATSSRRSNADPPPPPFSTAINMPVPMSTINEESPVPPPPRYDEVIVPISVISGSKLSEESIALPLSAPGTGVQPGRHRHSSLPSS